MPTRQQLLHRLVGGPQPEHPAARLVLGHGGGAHRRRLAVAGGSDQRPQGGAGRAQVAHCLGLVVTEVLVPTQARLDDLEVEAVVVAPGELLESAEHVVLQCPVLGRRPARRLAPLGSDSRRQPHGVGRVEERLGQLGDLLYVHRPSERAHTAS